MREHLIHCAACRQELARTRQLIALTRHANEAPQGASTSAWAEAPRTVLPFRKATFSTSSHRSWFLVAAALAAAVGVMAGRLSVSAGSPEPAPRVVSTRALEGASTVARRRLEPLATEDFEQGASLGLGMPQAPAGTRLGN